MKKALFALLSLLCLCAIAPAQTPNILSPNWYPQYAPVDANGSDFKLVIAWVKTKTGIATDPTITAAPFIGSTFLAPAQLNFTCAPDGKLVQSDAVLTFYFPAVAVVSIEQSCGLPLTYPGTYSKPTPPPAPAPTAPAPTILVGPAIAGTAGWYQTVPGDNSPDGAVYSDSRGTFVKIVKASVVGSSAFWYLISQ